MIRALLLSALMMGAAVAFADSPPADPIDERAQAIAEAATLLTKAGAALKKGNRNFAEQLFSAAEIIVGPASLAELAPLFRKGAPARITTPLSRAPKDAAPQPATVGSSEEDAPAVKPARGSLDGQLTLASGAPAGQSVVTLEPTAGKFRAPAPKRRVMEQRGREFAPKIMVVPVGSTVTFPNFDNVYHNVFTRSEAPAFDLGLYKSGDARDFTFLKPGNFHLGCNLHANMAAQIVVVNAPYYVVSDVHGHFSFRNVPPGKYTLNVFTAKHDAPQTQTVVIGADKNSVTVMLRSDLPERVAVDKFGAPREK